MYFKKKTSHHPPKSTNLLNNFVTADSESFEKTLPIKPRGYLGQKGYTLLKNELTPEQQEELKRELTAKPMTQGAVMAQAHHTFPVYRESDNKFYVPRYFGESYFGPHTKNKIPPGCDITVQFMGDLRDNQKPVVKSYIEHVSKADGGCGLLELPCAYGKTVLSINIISILRKKTLVIVHKEFLMNQWIERISQFLPSARVGKIQGQIVDIEDKDIVIGMLQSLSMKDYPGSMFDSFGLTIIDEVHHISSEVFSCALFKIVTKYMLGLSATMNRKDGTTKIFKMFLGEVVYKGERDEQHSVVVRAIDYVSNDEDFKEVVTDYRGQVQYSTMITKLCGFNHRSEFILSVLVDLIRESSEKNIKQQIMILAHNKNLLKYLYDAIEARNIATVGYYVGGMKEAALKESESKKVIIATYSMAAEALDIKTLTTLIMATPKTDIEQAVGRILREKHGSPIVVDIIDEHQPFKNQWSKRKTFYRKQNYKIIHSSNLNYNPDVGKWKVLYNPKLEGGGCVSATNDEINEKNDLLQGKCLISIKKKTEQK
uniref:Helicase ATP-binding domain-containing protein n=1 Tax=viral metagenome TaxID=1070528 RepID=A0A6C0DFM9_9ZZZZ